MAVKEQILLTTKRRTVEMTWGETAATQRQGNGRAKKQSRCFALTSIELLAAVIIIHLVTMRENPLVQNARRSSTPPSARVLASL